MAKRKGIAFGRPKNPLPENFGEVYERWVRKAIIGVEAAKLCGIPPPTFYRKAKEWAEKGFC